MRQNQCRFAWTLSAKMEKKKCAGRLLSGGGGEYRPAPARPTGTAASAGKTGMRFNGSAYLHKLPMNDVIPRSVAGKFDYAEIKQQPKEHKRQSQAGDQHEQYRAIAVPLPRLCGGDVFAVSADHYAVLSGADYNIIRGG
jgi:hypothetical protein